MNTKEYDLVVYIGRFQPFHVAHQKTIERGFELADNVLVLIGSPNKARDIVDPWTFHERVGFISYAFYDEYYTSDTPHSLDIAALPDIVYDNNAWIAETGHIVEKHAKDIGASRIAIIGHDKDTTSFYLNYFQHWGQIDMPAYPPVGDTIDATKIRRLMFEKNSHFTKGVLPENVYNYLFVGEGVPPEAWVDSHYGKLMFNEWDYNVKEKKKWANTPHASQFVTSDAVVLQSGHILLIRRKSYPGHGLWAMPGGFVEEWERIRPSILRELYEETKLKVPVMVLDRAIDAHEYFDDPKRSTRGRTYSHTFRMTLDPTQKLPKVKGDGKETFEAKWFTLSEFQEMESVMFEDHFHIVNYMLKQPERSVRG